MQENESRFEYFYWEDSFHRLPEDFSFTNGGILTAWQSWCCSDSIKKIPPLRTTGPRDHSKKNGMRKRSSDYRFLMAYIEQEVKQKGAWKDNPSIEEANEMFYLINETLPLPEYSGKNRKRRIDQMKWNTAVNILTKQLKLEDK